MHVQQVTTFVQGNGDEKCSSCQKPVGDDRVITLSLRVFHKTCLDQNVQAVDPKVTTKGVSRFQALVRGHRVRRYVKAINSALFGNKVLKSGAIKWLLTAKSERVPFVIQGARGTGRSTLAGTLAQLSGESPSHLFLTLGAYQPSLSGESGVFTCIEVEHGTEEDLLGTLKGRPYSEKEIIYSGLPLFSVLSITNEVGIDRLSKLFPVYPTGTCSRG